MIVIALGANQKYYTTGELKDMGYSYYKIGQMEKRKRTICPCFHFWRKVRSSIGSGRDSRND